MEQSVERSFDDAYGGGSYKGERWHYIAFRGKLNRLWRKMRPRSRGGKAHKNSKSERAANNELEYEQFVDALKSHHIPISSESARNVFAEIGVNRRGSVTKHNMEGFLTRLDVMQEAEGVVTGGSHLHLAKNVIECLLGGARAVGELTVCGATPGSTPGCTEVMTTVQTPRPRDMISPEMLFALWDSDALCFLKKLGNRDVAGEDRIGAMNAINAGIRRGETDYVALLKHDGYVRRLLFGIAAELLDAEESVQGVAAEVAPDLLDECMAQCVENKNVDVVYEHLPSIFDNFFCVLDDARSKANHAAVRRGVDAIIENIIARQTPGNPVDDTVTYLLCVHLYAL